ncbi:MAG: hypothetical protein IKS05_02460 [Oscillospiraceae bacterium]|nr:hypothetical protein [Oscillospiraceae bacterium]
MEVNETDFPDEIFYDYVLCQFDRNSDGWLNHDELSNATYFFAEGSGNLTSLKGIELLYALEDLDTGECGITSLDLRGNRNLTSVSLYGNPLTELRLEGLSELNYLSVAATNLSTLDLSQNPELHYLYAYDCPNLSVLDIRSCPNLVNIYKNGQKTDYGTYAADHYGLDGVGELVVDKSLTVIAD